jgi:hypothetical protein
MQIELGVETPLISLTNTLPPPQKKPQKQTHTQHMNSLEVFDVPNYS